MKAFFQVLFSLFLTIYKGNNQLMDFGSWCPTGVFWKVENNVSVLFFFWNFFPIKTHVFGMSFVFCIFCLFWWGFEFAPAGGSSDSVSDFVMTSQDYIKVEHYANWLLSSRLAEFQQLYSECFFSNFVLFNSYYLQKPSSVDALRVPVFHWFFSELPRIMILFSFLSEMFKWFSS